MSGSGLSVLQTLTHLDFILFFYSCIHWGTESDVWLPTLPRIRGSLLPFKAENCHTVSPSYALPLLRDCHS